MASNLLQIYPNNILRQQCKSVVDFDKDRDIISILSDFVDSLKGAAAVAANQLGYFKRIFVLSSETAQKYDCHKVYINPVMTITSDETRNEEEGCLSIPGYSLIKSRFLNVSVTASDLYGHQFSETVTGFLARCFQHEIEHLDGKLMIDNLSKAERLKIAERVSKVRR